SNKLRGLAIYENNQLIDMERVKVNNLNMVGNPLFLKNNNNENLSMRVEITSLRANRDFIYEFVLSDFGGDTAIAQRTILVKSDPPRLRYNGPELTVATIGNEARFKLNGVKGSGLLQSLQVLQNNVAIDPSRISFGTIRPTSNPFQLDGTDANVFDKDILIQSPSAADSYIYTFILRDELDAIGVDSARVLAGTPATELVSKNLYNASRGGNFGALNLIDGSSASVNSNNADLIDIGIDSSATNVSLNWKRQFRAGKDVEIKRILIGQNGIAQTFSYINIFTKEQMVDLFGRGVLLTQKDNEGRLITDPIQIGQIFIIKKLNQYYLLEVAAVIQTAQDNEDYYRFNYKN
ncbi:MAG TPA: hypothetical protein PKD85_11585, partial [Saprospiraceae bacterium]|nr:hypothetical protein [Saprospiraceae bacterium]